MRHPIEKSPRDGTTIILEDGSGTYDVAHWSTEPGQRLGENSEPTRITPTHRHPLARDQYLRREDERSRNQSRRGRARRLAVSSRYFRAEVAAYVTRYAGHEEGSRKSNLVAQSTIRPSRQWKRSDCSRKHTIPPFCLAPMERVARRRKHASITRRHMLAAWGGKGPTRRIGPVRGAGFNSCIVDAG